MRYIDIPIRTLIRHNASEKDIPALDWDEQQKHLSMIKARIDDVEIVVRCKDCKWWQDSEVGVVECSICTRIHDMVFEMGADDYCSMGKRKGGDDE